MKDKIKEVINEFREAIATRDTGQLDVLLHPDFQVMANRFKGAPGMTIIPKELYINMMDAQKVGGTLYDVEMLNLIISDYTAVAEFNFLDKDTISMHVFLSLILDENNAWKIISNLPIVPQS